MAQLKSLYSTVGEHSRASDSLYTAYATLPRNPDETYTCNINTNSINNLTLESQFDWNEAFQLALDMSESTSTESLLKYQRLVQLSDDFVRIARTYGHIILSEIFLSDDMKTIKPAKLGGVAGGQKYVVHGIVFKFCRDVMIGMKSENIEECQYLYGGNNASYEFAAKAGGHEILGASQYFQFRSFGFTVPIQACVDYSGFRILVMPLLPLKDMIYGSSNAGKTVIASNDKFNKIMKRTADFLHLSEHMVQSNDDQEEPCVLYSAGDVEGHNGKDNRFYLLDLSRSFPAESPTATQHLSPSDRSVFYRHLRPELLQYLKAESLSLPLNPDCFTRWGRIESQHHNLICHQAALILLEKRIPDFAEELVIAMYSLPDRKPGTFLSYGPDLNVIYYPTILPGSSLAEMLFNLPREMHQRGINIRHLGLLRSEVLKKMKSFAINEFKEYNMLKDDGWVFFHGIDSDGSDYYDDDFLGLHLYDNVEGMKKEAEKRSSIVIGYNTNGFMKSSILPQWDWKHKRRLSKNTTSGLYVKIDYLLSDEYLSQDPLPQIIVAEITSRAVKNLLRLKLRKAHQESFGSESVLLETTSSFFNSICCPRIKQTRNDDDNDMKYQSTIQDTNLIACAEPLLPSVIFQRFGKDALKGMSSDRKYMFPIAQYLYRIVTSTLKACGIILTPSTLIAFKERPESFFFAPIDFSFSNRIKYIPFITLIRGKYLLFQIKNILNPEAIRFLKLAENCFKIVLDINPHDYEAQSLYHICHNLSIALDMDSKGEYESSDARLYYGVCKALGRKPNDEDISLILQGHQNLTLKQSNSQSNIFEDNILTNQNISSISHFKSTSVAYQLLLHTFTIWQSVTSPSFASFGYIHRPRKLALHRGASSRNALQLFSKLVINEYQDITNKTLQFSNLSFDCINNNNEFEQQQQQQSISLIRSSSSKFGNSQNSVLFSLLYTLGISQEVLCDDVLTYGDDNQPTTVAEYLSLLPDVVDAGRNVISSSLSSRAYAVANVIRLIFGLTDNEFSEIEKKQAASGISAIKNQIGNQITNLIETNIKRK